MGAHPLLAKRWPPPLPRPKSTEGAKTTKKTAKTTVPADGEKKRKRRKATPLTSTTVRALLDTF